MRQRFMVAIAGLVGFVILAGSIAVFTVATSTCVYAQNNSCASACRAAHNECRISTKGSSSCDAQFQACLQGCLRR
jgi:hypothetical protein